MEEAKFIFTSDPIQLKSEGNDFFVEGYISTSDLDLVNDIVTKSCLLDMAEQMKERVIKFDVEHESFRGKSNLEREMNKTTIPVAKVEDFLMDKKGLKVRAKLNRHAKRFQEVMGSIKDGFLDAFSIAYVPIKAAIQNKDGQEIRLLDKINLLNVAFTGNPINTEARMTNVFAKSLEFLKDQENHNHISDTIKLQEAKMSEDTEKNEAQENEAESENSESQEAETEQKDEEQSEKPEGESENAEVKALKEKVGSLEKEMAELKSKIKAPVRKSRVEQQDKSKQFEGAEGKSLNPLDVIA